MRRTPACRSRPPPVRIRSGFWKRTLAERVESALGELPAYLRRARRVERVRAALFSSAAREYEKRLRFVHMRRNSVQNARGDAAIRRTRRSLIGALERFDKSWTRWVERDAPIERVNEEIRGYNRYFELERQCALKYVPVTAAEFEPQPEVSREEVLARFPLLGPTAPAPPSS